MATNEEFRGLFTGEDNRTSVEEVTGTQTETKRRRAPKHAKKKSNTPAVVFAGVAVACITAGSFMIASENHKESVQAEEFTSAQSLANDKLTEAWSEGKTSAPLGADAPAAKEEEAEDTLIQGSWLYGTATGSEDALYKMQIPDFGKDWDKVVFDGVTAGALSKGPGVYPGTAEPGVKGNLVMAGHRNGPADAFRSIEDLHSCSPIRVETKDRTYTYSVLPQGEEGEDTSCFNEATKRKLAGEDYRELKGHKITSPEDVDVVLPVPGKEDSDTPGLALLTLTTCHPENSNKQRYIVHAVLTEESPQ